MIRPGPVGILPLGAIPPLVPKVIAAHVNGYLNLETIILEPMPSPK